ncbi:DivIVA domain-containing protein [Aeromicrobium alkaliterrae]|uniref:Antigen 84 n=1 Tax=Aeromicrobium alkaliterrae TaxID=302168 RepID=A0ABN2JKK6_9ACTN
MTTPRFTLVRFREGYDIEEVDAFVKDVDTALASRRTEPGLAERITAARFTPRRFRQAYDMGEVDQHLDELHRQASASS